jgi:choline-glycine betaine transporter
VRSRIPFVPWWPLATAILLITALSIAVSSGRTIEAVIVGVLAVPTLAFLGLWLVAWKRGL